MKFTGVYAAYYQDICKQWNRVIAKSMNLQKNKPELHNRISTIIKDFNKTVDNFNGTSFVDDKTIRVNGIAKHYYRISETLLQIRCVFTLKEKCSKATILTDHSDTRSLEDYDALFKYVEKEYGFLIEILKLYIAEDKKINNGKNSLWGIRIVNEIREACEKYRERHSFNAPMMRAHPSKYNFRRLSEEALNNYNYWTGQSRGVIFHEPYFL